MFIVYTLFLQLHDGHVVEDLAVLNHTVMALHYIVYSVCIVCIVCIV